MVVDPASHLAPVAGLGAAQWLGLALSGLLATAVGALVWNHALSTLGVARTALYAYWVPIFGVVIAVTLLGEPLTVWHGRGPGRGAGRHLAGHAPLALVPRPGRRCRAPGAAAPGQSLK